MSPEESRKLLAGYATDGLSDEERIALFEAALDDQELFDQLAEEDALKEVIETPGVRDRLIAGLAPALQQPPQPRTVRAWWLRPWPLTGLVGTAAVVVVLWAIFPRTTLQPGIATQAQESEPAKLPQPAEVAENRQPAQTARARGRVGENTPGVKGAEAKDGPMHVPVPASPSVQIASADRVPEAIAAGELRRERDAAATSTEQPQVTAEATLAKSERKTDTAAPVSGVAAPATALGAADSEVTTARALAPSPPPAAKPTSDNLPANPLRQGFAGPGAAKGGAARPSPQAISGFVPAVLPFGFRYRVQPGSLQVTPTSAGFLTVRGTGLNPQMVLFQTSQVSSGVLLTISIPELVQRLSIEFSAGADGVAGALEQRRELEGVVTLRNPTATSRLEVSVPARP